MAYSDYLVERVRQRLKGAGPLEEKKMMGGLLFIVNTKMCIGVDVDKKTGHDRLLVRVGKLNYEALLQRRGAKKMDFTGKPMGGFLFLNPEAFDSEIDLDFWVGKALEFNALL